VTANSRDVFVNCPFDGAFAPLMQAMIFAVYGCGFRVRCAREMADGGETRIEKLYNIIEQTRYGIHDISRTELDPVNELPRFNMPLELGFFLGAKRYGDPEQKKKRCLILDVEPYRYQKFISDLAGADITAHANDPKAVVKAVRDWLVTVSRRKTIPTPAVLLASYEDFIVKLPEIAHQAGLDDAALLYADFERLVISWVKSRVAP
jgi:hypothetical protein